MESGSWERRGIEKGFDIDEIKELTNLPITEIERCKK